MGLFKRKKRKPKPMRPFADIVRDYEKALELSESFPVAIPVSMLHDSVDHIKHAVIAAYRDAKDAVKKEQLKTAYASLASFFPDEKARRVNRSWQHAISVSYDQAQLDALKGGEDFREMRGTMDQIAQAKKLLEEESGNWT
jgi:hypothetical protein